MSDERLEQLRAQWRRAGGDTFVSETDMGDLFAEIDRLRRAAGEVERMREALRRAKQFVSVASDWNFDECEIDGVMVRTHKFASELAAALEATHDH